MMDEAERSKVWEAIVAVSYLENMLLNLRSKRRELLMTEVRTIRDILRELWEKDQPKEVQNDANG